MKTMPEFPDALELSTLLILTCISMLCMCSPAAIKAKYISLIKLTDFSREVVRERARIKGTRNTGTGMIACQEKWHLSTLAEFSVHSQLDSSHAYTEEERETIAALVVMCPPPSTIRDSIKHCILHIIQC